MPTSMLGEKVIKENFLMAMADREEGNCTHETIAEKAKNIFEMCIDTVPDKSKKNWNFEIYY